jgi:hypothetical protein
LPSPPPPAPAIYPAPIKVSSPSPTTRTVSRTTSLDATKSPVAPMRVGPLSGVRTFSGSYS